MLKYTTPLACGMLAAGWLSCASAQAPDNSKTNKTDSTNSQMTAEAQGNGSGDIAITSQIRKSVVADKSLSTYGHNVKIVAVNGNVTLNGVVRSDAEKSNIEMKAAAVAGADHVTNDLKVSPAK